MRKTKNGSVVLGRFEIFYAFPRRKNWRLGSFNIGDTKVLMIGPYRIFVR